MSRATRSYSIKKGRLLALLREVEGAPVQSDTILKVHRVLRYFARVCSRDVRFSGHPGLMDIVASKLAEFAREPLWGSVTSSMYHRRIFLPSARTELLLLRARAQRGGPVVVRGPRRPWVQTTRWVCLRCPTRAFRAIWEYIGPYWNCSVAS